MIPQLHQEWHPPSRRPILMATHSNSRFLTIIREHEKKIQQNSAKIPWQEHKCSGQINRALIDMDCEDSTDDQNQCGLSLGTRKGFTMFGLTGEIESILKKRQARWDALREAACDLKLLLKSKFAHSSSFVVGSFAAEVSLDNSDLDFSIESFAIADLCKYNDKLDAIRRNIDLSIFLKTKRTPPRVTYQVVTITHKNGIEIDVTMNNEDARRNTQILAWYNQAHPRFAELCQAVKCWAADAKIKNAKNGFFNSFSLCILVIFYLQKFNIVPNIQEILPGTNGLIDVNKDYYYRRNVPKELEAAGFVAGNESLGILFYGFIKFYADFDFKTKWISIKRGAALDKKLDARGCPLEGLPENHRFIVLEDPFMEKPFNCARAIQTVENFQKIQDEFKEAEAILDNFNRFPFKEETDDDRQMPQNSGVIPDDFFTLDHWTKQMKSLSVNRQTSSKSAPAFQS